jgi:nicotinamide-nucleotide amidase
MLDSNLKQAEVPDVCTVLMNQRGTAPGMWFEKNEKIFISLPGVPHEMKGLMTKEVLPRLRQYFKMPFILHQTFLTYGIGESFLAEKIKSWEQQLPKHIKLAYLPHYGNVRLRLTGISNDKSKLEKELEEQSKSIKPLISEWLVVEDDMTIQQVVAKTLKEKKQTLGTAESCTGGYIAHLITQNAGASLFFKGTIVAYDNEVKKSILKVSDDTLRFEGAVSETTAREMAKGVLENLNTDYALATTGIMGPDGGTEEKPVGTVWIAVGNASRIETQKFNFRFDRLRNIEQTSHTALNMLRKFIQSEDVAGK